MLTMPDARTWANEFVPELDQLIDIHIEADVLSSTFAQDLLINANPVLTDVKIVGFRRATPTDVGG
jgi:hypothetical protein